MNSDLKELGYENNESTPVEKKASKKSKI